jgi:hypothetical protein
MQRELIEEIVSKEFRKLFDHYELFENEPDQSLPGDPGGLCKTCDRADKCELPGRRTGTWHCKDFE